MAGLSRCFEFSLCTSLFLCFSSQATSTERSDLERSWADARRVQRESESSREAAAALTERAEGRERRAKESEERAAVLEREAAGRVAEGTAAVAVNIHISVYISDD